MEFEKHVKLRQEKFGAVIFETLREKIFVTNETGAEVVRLLEQGKEAEDISSEFETIYDCDPLTIKNDVIDLISKLKENGIVRI